MALINWKDEFSVGVRAFDDQHKKLVAMINEFHDAMSKGSADAVLADLFAKLGSYTRTHFAEEERAFKKTGYPLTDEHVDEHRRLIVKVEELSAKQKSGKSFLTVETSQFLKSWLMNHIMGTDKKYTAHMNGHGVL